MFYYITFFGCGAIVGGCIGAIIMAAVASGRDRTMPRWSDFFEKH